jgi:hypothetical protein
VAMLEINDVTFTPGLAIKIATFDLSAAPGGWISMDNINISAVPKAGSWMMWGALARPRRLVASEPRPVDRQDFRCQPRRQAPRAPISPRPASSIASVDASGTLDTWLKTTLSMPRSPKSFT